MDGEAFWAVDIRGVKTPEFEWDALGDGSYDPIKDPTLLDYIEAATSRLELFYPFFVFLGEKYLHTLHESGGLSAEGVEGFFEKFLHPEGEMAEGWPLKLT